MEKIVITQSGYEKLIAKLDFLRLSERKKVIEDISEARSHGDLRENSEYSAAKERQAQLEAQIAQLENVIAACEIFNPYLIENRNVISFGAKILLEDEDGQRSKTFFIVSEYEADLPNGMISFQAPIAKKMLGKQVGDDVELAGGIFVIKLISYEKS